MLIFSYFFLTLISLIIATYTDLKERMVYNKLTYSIAIIAIILKIIESIQTQTIEPIFLSISAGIIAFVFGWLLWKLGVWAGGDVKLVTAIALLNPINYAIIGKFLNFPNPLITISLPLFAITLIIYSSLSVMPIGFLMSITAIFKHKEILTKVKQNLIKKGKQLISLSVLLAGLKIIIETIPLDTFFILPFVILIGFLPKKIRVITIILTAITGAILSLEPFLFNSITICLPLIIVYAFWKLYSESKQYAFREKILLKDLEEGMIPDKYIIEKNGVIEFTERPSIKRVIKNIMNNKIETTLEDFKIKGNIIGNPSIAGGFTQEQVDELKEKAKQGKMPKEIIVRKTMAFVPAILLGYILLQVTGDILWAIFI